MFPSATRAIDRLSIDDHRDPRYLPYRIDVKPRDDWSQAGRSMIDDGTWPILNIAGNSSSGIVAICHNPNPGANETPQATFNAYPNWHAISDVPIPYTLTDIQAFRMPNGRNRLLALGHRNDSVSVFEIDTSGAKAPSFVCAMSRLRPGDDKWKGNAHFFPLIDSSSAGASPCIYLQVTPGRDFAPDLLVCMHLDDLSIRWKASVPGQVYKQDLLKCRDSQGSGILFTIYGTDNGHRAGQLDDQFARVVRIDSTGAVVWSKIAGARYINCRLLPVFGDTLFCLSSSIAPVPSNEFNDSAQTGSYLSLINSYGDILATIRTGDLVRSLWSVGERSSNRRLIYSISVTGIARVFNDSLRLQSESGPTIFQDLAGKLDSWGDLDHVFLLRGSDITGVFADNFRLLAVVKDAYAYTHPFGFRDGYPLFVLSAPTKYAVCEVSKRTALDLASQVYLDYQPYFLSTLVGSLVALALVNAFRRRKARDLVLITAQKRELEAAHQELEATHARLREAQQTIISQEKFRQAQDIAGGFAHEIRNALFPADSAITTLHTLAQSGPVDSRAVASNLDDVSEALGRAIGITELISSYTKLDTLYNVEKTNIDEVANEVLNANRMRISQESVVIQTTGGPQTHVAVNRRQFYMVVNNLVLNSLDALTNRTNPTILMSWESQTDLVHFVLKDNGCGMQTDVCARVFDPFFSTKPYRGTGLGLTITKKIIEMYGGTISVTSELGKGTAFEINLKHYRDES